jgi:hypothetical protein
VASLIFVLPSFSTFSPSADSPTVHWYDCPFSRHRQGQPGDLVQPNRLANFASPNRQGLKLPLPLRSKAGANPLRSTRRFRSVAPSHDPDTDRARPDARPDLDAHAGELPDLYPLDADPRRAGHLDTSAKMSRSGWPAFAPKHWESDNKRNRVRGLADRDKKRRQKFMISGRNR